MDKELARLYQFEELQKQLYPKLHEYLIAATAFAQNTKLAVPLVMCGYFGSVVGNGIAKTSGQMKKTQKEKKAAFVYQEALIAFESFAQSLAHYARIQMETTHDKEAGVLSISLRREK